MFIRKAVAEDAKKISELITSLSHCYLSQKQQHLPAWFLSSIDESECKKRLNDREFVNLISMINNEIIAYISMTSDGHLYHLFVAEQHQHKGIGRLLWNKVILQCPASKYTVRSSLNAVAVYTAFGFIISTEQGEKDGLQFQTMELSNRTSNH